jgi:hypothetical protein
MSTISPKSTADVEALKARATRPHLTGAERLAEHSRLQRDHFIDRAARALEKPEREGRRADVSELVAAEMDIAESERWSERYARFKAAG